MRLAVGVVAARALEGHGLAGPCSQIGAGVGGGWTRELQREFGLGNRRVVRLGRRRLHAQLGVVNPLVLHLPDGHLHLLTDGPGQAVVDDAQGVVIDAILGVIFPQVALIKFKCLTVRAQYEVERSTGKYSYVQLQGAVMLVNIQRLDKGILCI